MHSWPKDHAMPKSEKSAFVDTLKGLLCVFDFRNIQKHSETFRKHSETFRKKYVKVIAQAGNTMSCGRRTCAYSES